MTMQEMSTAVQYDLPIKIFILNNEWMGMVRQWQQLLHGERYRHSYSESLPDFVKLAEAYGGVGIRCEKPDELDGAIQEMIDVTPAGDLRLPRRQARELLPDDPVRQGPQRDACWPTRPPTRPSPTRSTPRARLWCKVSPDAPRLVAGRGAGREGEGRDDPGETVGDGRDRDPASRCAMRIGWGAGTEIELRSRAARVVLRPGRTCDPPSAPSKEQIEAFLAARIKIDRPFPTDEEIDQRSRRGGAAVRMRHAIDTNVLRPPARHGRWASSTIGCSASLEAGSLRPRYGRPRNASGCFASVLRTDRPSIDRRSVPLFDFPNIVIRRPRRSVARARSS